MLIGNPYKFAIYAELVKEWNDKGATWHNGLLYLYVDGTPFPDEAYTATFEVDIRKLIYRLSSIGINKELFNEVQAKAYEKMCDIAFQISNESDIWHQNLISPPTLYDYNYYIFAVSDGKQIRILAARPDEKDEYEDGYRLILQNLKIKEAFIPCEYLEKMLLELENWTWK